jgi:UDP-N-acetylmuramate dehydrogenase
MQVQENISLKPYNTFGIDAKARFFGTFKDQDELSEINDQKSKHPTTNFPLFILGGGSNILLTKDFNGFVLKNELQGIEVLHEDPDHVYVRAGAGENWHSFVLYCIQRNWAGLENLSLIPGSVGASPMQNIGAYGVELEDRFHSLEAWHIVERKVYSFSKSDCEFAYRDSVFKHRHKDQFVILNVTFQLLKKPIFHTSYGAITEELSKMDVRDLSIQAISQAVINIRSSKLPDPKQIGNAGSFFKNPTVSKNKFDSLKQILPDIVGHPQSNGDIKLAAGWMIEQCGWKGFRSGDAGVHEKQALVLVNYGHANGNDILELSEKIMKSVKEKFSVNLEREVNII